MRSVEIAIGSGSKFADGMMAPLRSLLSTKYCVTCGDEVSLRGVDDYAGAVVRGIDAGVLGNFRQFAYGGKKGGDLC